MRSAYRFVRQTLACYSADRASSFAAAIAYYTLFSIFPLAVFLIGIGSYFLSEGQRQQLVSSLTSALGGASTANVAQQVYAASHGRAGLGIIGLVGALWSATAVFAAIRTGLNVVWKRKKALPWWRQKLADLGGVGGLTVVLALSFAGASGVTFAESVATGMFGRSTAGIVTFLLGSVITLMPIFIIVLAFGLLYIWASPPEIGWQHVWPGSTLCAVGFVLLSFFFGLYARNFGHYDRVYGSLGAVVAFLFYAYLVGSLILLGAELTAQYARVRRERAVPQKAACDLNQPGGVPAPAGGTIRTGSRESGPVVMTPAGRSAEANEGIAVGDLFPQR